MMALQRPHEDVSAQFVADCMVDHLTSVPANGQVPIYTYLPPPPSYQLQEFVDNMCICLQPSLAFNYELSANKENLKYGIPDFFDAPTSAEEPDLRYYNPSYLQDDTYKDQVMSCIYSKERKYQQMNKIPPQMMCLDSQSVSDIPRYHSSSFKDLVNLKPAHDADFHVSNKL